jgi:uncharacterized alpha/beta hydrolase family protein
LSNSNSRPEVQKVVQLANQLNDAMKKLDDALTGNDAIKQTSNYFQDYLFALDLSNLTHLMLLGHLSCR